MRSALSAALLVTLATFVAGCGTARQGNADQGTESCNAPKTLCSGACVDLQTSPSNCGQCGMACRFGDVCMAGACVLVCDSALTACGNPASCVNTMSDPANCGTCGNACPMGNGCQAGMCVVSCQVQLINCGGVCTDTQTDIANCGGCDLACPTGNVCKGGVCHLSCAPGFNACTGNGVVAVQDAGVPLNSDDGGEGDGGEGDGGDSVDAGGGNSMGPGAVCVDLQSDNYHCGSCQIACPMGSSCNKGHCIISCPPGFATCDGNCVNLTIDSLNCGGCDQVCPQGQLCENSKCQSPCQKPLQACQGGCADLRFDPMNCGSCGLVCSEPNATPACISSQCGVGKCDPGYADCDQAAANGCEVNTVSDASNCLACGQSCTVANGVGQCVNGCLIGMCNAGFGDCDGLYLDGCEENLSTSPKNCGSCGNTCPVTAHASAGCSMGNCGIGACAAGYSDCDMTAANGCEINTAADPNNCGMCGTVCPGVTNATPGCTNGACGLGTCSAGYADCNGLKGDGCECNVGAGFACIGIACVPRSCRAIQAAGIGMFDGVYSIAPDGITPVYAYCDMTNNGGGWTLLMKLVGGSFCFGDPNWTSTTPLNETTMTNLVLPAVGGADAKHRAFYLMSDVTSLRFVTLHNTAVVTFTKPSNAMTLMTTNTIPFAAYPDYPTWKAAFQQDRSGNPIFLRAGIPVTAGYSCRSNIQSTPLGCGQLCEFCYLASDSGTCVNGPAPAAGNDVSSGVGINKAYCGSNTNATNCSTASAWSDSNQRTLVWGK